MPQRERAFEGRERSRIALFERERARESRLAEKESADYHATADRLARFNDEDEGERARELFYSDP